MTTVRSNPAVNRAAVRALHDEKLTKAEWNSIRNRAVLELAGSEHPKKTFESIKKTLKQLAADPAAHGFKDDIKAFVLGELSRELKKSLQADAADENPRHHGGYWYASDKHGHTVRSRERRIYKG